MRLLVALGLVSLILLTAARLPAWRDNRSLLRAAVQTAPDLPRPAVNLGIALARHGDHLGAALWLQRAIDLAERRQGPRDAEVVMVAKRGLLWIEAFGTCTQAAPSC